MRRPYKHIDLNDKFSDFEHTPEDSSWNTISGGINSRQSAGGLADKMDELSVQPSAAVWSDIAAQTHPNRKKKAVLWWSYGAAASLISAVLLASLVFNSSPDLTSLYTPRGINSEHLSSWDEDSADQENSTKIANKENSLTTVSEEISNQPFQKEKPSFDSKGSRKSLIANQANDKSFNSTSSPDKTEGLIQQVIEEGETLYSSTGNENGLHPLHLNSEDSLVTFRINKTRLKPRFYLDYSTVDIKDNLAVSTFPFWLTAEDDSPRLERGKSTTSLLAFTQLNQSNSSTSDGMAFLTSNTPNTFTETSDLTLAFGEAASIQFRSQEKFSAPLYFSLNLERTLPLGRVKRWSAGSGLGYLLMRSSITYESTEITSLTNIKRNYIAVPLYLKYEFIKKPRWSAYSALGTSAELGIGGKAETKDYRDDVLESSSSSRFNLGAGQFNINGSVGFNFKLNTNLTAFSEASVAHYFYQSNYNFWSSKDLWPGIKTGISLRF